MEISFAELKSKQIVNVVDGKCLGRIIDIILDAKSCKILGIVVPNPSCQGWFFKKNREIFVPFNAICKIGVDVILIELYVDRRDDCEIDCDCNIKDKKPNKDDCKCKTFTLNDKDYNIK